MISFIFKKAISNISKRIKVISIDDLETHNKITTQYPFLSNKSSPNKAQFRRSISRIKEDTSFQTEWLKHGQPFIIGLVSGEQIESTQCYLPFISSFHCIFYEFIEGSSKYYLIVGDYWFEKLAYYFPEDNLLVSLRDDLIFDPKNLIAHFKLYKLKHRGLNKTASKKGIVLYHDHLAHHILNEISGIQYLLNNNLEKKINVVYHSAQPVVDLKKLITPITNWTIKKLNKKAIDQSYFYKDTMLFPYQKCWLEKNTIDTITRSFSNLNEKTESLTYDVVIWMSIRVGNRMWVNQNDFLNHLSKYLVQKNLSYIFLIDGYSKPFEYTNKIGEQFDNVKLEESNYLHEMLSDKKINYKSLIGEDIQTVLTLAQKAHLYIAHSGTLHHKPSWFNDIPGIVHSNVHFSKRADEHLPGIQEKELWKHYPIRIPPKFIKDENMQTRDKEGNILGEKFNNYSIDMDYLMDMVTGMIGDIN